jgi:hypothetical protein
VNNCGSCNHDCGDTADRCTAGTCMCGSAAECLIMCAPIFGCFPA